PRSSRGKSSPTSGASWRRTSAAEGASARFSAARFDQVEPLQNTKRFEPQRAQSLLFLCALCGSFSLTFNLFGALEEGSRREIDVDLEVLALHDPDFLERQRRRERIVLRADQGGIAGVLACPERHGDPEILAARVLIRDLLVVAIEEELELGRAPADAGA